VRHVWDSRSAEPDRIYVLYCVEFIRYSTMSLDSQFYYSRSTFSSPRDDPPHLRHITIATVSSACIHSYLATAVRHLYDIISVLLTTRCWAEPLE